MKAHEILEAGAGHLRDRAATYDKPEGERSMAATVDAFRAVTGHDLTEEQGWLFMALLKAVRSQQGAFRADSYEDGAAYLALAGEAAHEGARNPVVMAAGGNAKIREALLRKAGPAYAGPARRRSRCGIEPSSSAGCPPTVSALDAEGADVAFPTERHLYFAQSRATAEDESQ